MLQITQSLIHRLRNGAGKFVQVETNGTIPIKCYLPVDCLLYTSSKGGAACMILFCPFEQMHYYIELGQRYGLKRYIPLVFLSLIHIL